MTGRISSFQSMGTMDGPGVRFVIFMQGCNLKCAYCHNPETWEINSGGTLMTVQEVMTRALKYRPYFGDKGGITISGGEPLLQAEFMCELLSLCKKEGIHSAIDTNGTIITPSAKKAISLADLIIVDLKMNTNERYQRYIGAQLDKVLAFIKETEKRGKDIWVRQVILPTINDKEEDVKQLIELIRSFSNIKKIELLPFQKLCLEKYESLQMPFALSHLPEASYESISTLQSIIDREK